MPYSVTHAPVALPRGVAWRAPAGQDDTAEVPVRLALGDGGMLLRAGGAELLVSWPAWDLLHSAILDGDTPPGLIIGPSVVHLYAGDRSVAMSHGQWETLRAAVAAGQYADL